MILKRDAVLESKLGQTLFIELAQKLCRRSVEHKRGTRQHSRYEGLVIAHARQQKNEAKNPIHHLARCWRQLARDKIEHQLFSEARAVAVAVAERESRSLRIVSVGLENELLIPHAGPRPAHESRAVFRGVP